jgi:hypothetical protein
MKHKKSCSECLSSFTIQASVRRDVSQKAELDSKCHCFHKFPKRHNEAEVKHRDLQGDFQQSQPTLKVTWIS